jgi:hypothetical protein
VKSGGNKFLGYNNLLFLKVKVKNYLTERRNVKIDKHQINEGNSI